MTKPRYDVVQADEELSYGRTATSPCDRPRPRRAKRYPHLFDSDRVDDTDSTGRRSHRPRATRPLVLGLRNHAATGQCGSCDPTRYPHPQPASGSSFQADSVIWLYTFFSTEDDYATQPPREG